MEGCHSQTTWKARGIRLVPSGISQRNQKRMYLFFFSFIFRAARHSDSHVGAKHEAEPTLSPPLCVSVRRTSIVRPIAESHPQFVADISLAHQSTLRFLLAFSAIYTTDRRNTYTHRDTRVGHTPKHIRSLLFCFFFCFFVVGDGVRGWAVRLFVPPSLVLVVTGANLARRWNSASVFPSFSVVVCRRVRRPTSRQ